MSDMATEEKDLGLNQDVATEGTPAAVVVNPVSQGGDAQDLKRTGRMTLYVRRFMRRPSAVFGLVVLCILILFALFGAMVCPWKYDEPDFTALAAAPSADHWLGTTIGGSDMYAMIVRGLGRSLLVGIISSTLIMIISAVLGTAIAGMNVMLVLALGLLSTGVIGMACGSFDVFGWFGSMGEGIIGMGELIVVTLMAGGMLEMIRFNGGIDYILCRLTQRIKSKRGAELSIAALVSLANVCTANVCTANNTIAIITVGPLANDIAEQYKVDKRKSASILDTFSCVVQGIIPYGAQMLIAASLTQLSPLSIICYLYYPMALGAAVLLSILFRYPKRYS